MPRPVTLQPLDLDPPAQDSRPAPAALHPDAVEEVRLTAYESGYKAGWDDAACAAEADGTGAQREAARQLQALSFTFHEARAHLLEGLGPLLDAICARVLPQAAQSALAPLVREALMPLVHKALDRPVTLHLHPSLRPALEAAMADGAPVPVELVEDPDLGPGQLRIAAAGEERRIDTQDAIARVRDILESFFAQARADAPASPAADPVPPAQEMRHHG